MDPVIIETATVAMATFFATIGPLDVAAVYAGLTATETPKRRRAMAIRGTLIATGILVLFALVGEYLLIGLGISLAALRTGGGILLLLIGIDMVFARTSGSTSTTEEEEMEAMGKRDIAVFPLATPLIAGARSHGCGNPSHGQQRGQPRSPGYRSRVLARHHTTHLHHAIAGLKDSAAVWRDWHARRNAGFRRPIIGACGAVYIRRNRTERAFVGYITTPHTTLTS